MKSQCRQMRNSLLYGIVILLWAMTVSAQPPGTLWEKTYGGTSFDRALSVQQTSDHGYIITGLTYSYGQGECDVFLVKTDANGNALWTKTYGGADEDVGFSVRQTPDNGYIIAGYTGSFGATVDVYLIKTDENGDTIWTRTYLGPGGGEDVGQSVQLTRDGGYIIAGYCEQFSSKYVYFLKTDAAGNRLWRGTCGATEDDYGFSVDTTSDGGYIIAGRTSSYGSGDEDVYLVKLNGSGNVVGFQTYGGTRGDRGYSVQQTSDGGYIIAGRTSSFAEVADVYLIKTNRFLDTVWTRTYGGASVDEGYSVQQTSDGGYIVAGETYSFGAGAMDGYLIRTDPGGDTLWTKTYGGSGWDVCWSVQECHDNGYIVAGYTRSFGHPDGDFYLIRTEPYVGIWDESFPEVIPAISQTAPNPFSRRTTIRYSLAKETDVDLAVLDVTGRVVRTLVRAKQKAGVYKATWDVGGVPQKRLPKGVYFCRLNAGEFTATRKMVKLE